jgi:hypothetical protein
MRAVLSAMQSTEQPDDGRQQLKTAFDASYAFATAAAAVAVAVAVHTMQAKGLRTPVTARTHSSV